MNTDNELNSLIKAAFAKAEASIEPGVFVAETARRRRRHHRIRRLAMVMAVTAGGCVALLFLGDAITILGRRFAFTPASPAGFLACVLPLIVAGAVIDALPSGRRKGGNPPQETPGY
jgi:hypothetical protein